jgi:hypothetical protein
VKQSLRSWLWRVPVAQEVDEEIALHLELRTLELIARGVDPQVAREQALKRMGDVRQVKRELVELSGKRDREMKITQWLDEFVYDVKFALRQLRGAPAFTLIAVATLALGIGANSAIFALVDATLLRPLPFADPDRLISIHETQGGDRAFVSPVNMRDWLSRNRSLGGIAAFSPGVGGMVMAGADGQAETVSRQWVTAGIFDVLGVKAVVGRTFLRSDDEQRANVVVLSEPFWRSRFDADPAVIGRQIRLDGLMWTVVGVVPGDFHLVGRSSLWAMRPVLGAPERARGAYVFSAVGRLKPGATLDAARDDLSAVASALAREFPKTNASRGVFVESMHDSVVGGDLRLTSMIFLGVVGFVLLICCANVANLLLARATARTRELAVRAAPGRGPSPDHSSADDREHGLVYPGRRPGPDSGGGHYQRSARDDSRGPASSDRDTRLRLARGGLLRCGRAARGPAFWHCASVAGRKSLVFRGDGRRPADHHGRRWSAALPARHGRGGDRGAAALRGRPAASHPRGGGLVRPRVSGGECAQHAGRSPRLEVSNPRGAPAVL